VSISDKILTCRDCHNHFVWTVGEQNFFRAKGLQNIPARCDKCRDLRRRKEPRGTDTGTGLRIGGGVRTQPVCADCGLETIVPFAPRNGKPVYCSACYVKYKDLTTPAVTPTAPVSAEKQSSQ
jgi:CxxC-x17-CxxC domain-containing protein